MRRNATATTREHASQRVIDCSRPETFLFWFGFGATLAIVVITAFAGGSWALLLRVGSANPLLPRIQRELGSVRTVDPLGHDGQIYYLIARDPLGRRQTPEAIRAFDPNGPRYRYRRILFPLVAGGFGQFAGRATLYYMIAWLTLAMGAVAVATADLCFLLKLRPVIALAAVVNIGALMSLLFLTADVLAIALALSGCVLALRRRSGWAITSFALAALTKEVYVLVAWSMAWWLWRQGRQRIGAATAVLPTLPVLIWSAWVWTALPAPQEGFENLGVPMRGLFKSVPLWLTSETNRAELFLALFTLVTCVAAAVMVVVARSSLLRLLTGPWLVLAAAATVAVWGKPNNASRSFAIVWPFAILLLGQRLAPSRDPGSARRPDFMPSAPDLPAEANSKSLRHKQNYSR